MFDKAIQKFLGVLPLLLIAAWSVLTPPEAHAATGDAQWETSVSNKGVNGEIFAMTTFGTNLYAAGYFTSIGGVPANHIAMWNGNSWQALSTGVRGTNSSPVYTRVDALASDGQYLYAAGVFNQAGGVNATNIAQWDGANWSALGPGLGNYSSANYVNALAVLGNQVYAAGVFNTAGGTAATNIATWNGSTWAPMIDHVPYDDGGTTFYQDINGVSGTLYSLTVYQGQLILGGLMQPLTDVANTPAPYTSIHGTNIARWSGTKWERFDTGLGIEPNNSVYALTTDGTNLYAGGNFTVAGSLTVNRVARWDGSQWNALGTGTDSTVKSLAWLGNTLYAGGTFLNAGGSSVGKIAQWNGASWLPLGSGAGTVANQEVDALYFIGTDLFVGGYFTQAGGRTAGGFGLWHSVLPAISVQAVLQAAGLQLTASNSVAPFHWEQSDTLAVNSWVITPNSTNLTPLAVSTNISQRFFRIKRD